MSVDLDLWQILEISFLFSVLQWCCHFVERSFQKGFVMGSEIDMIFIKINITDITSQFYFHNHSHRSYHHNHNNCYLSSRLFIIKTIYHQDNLSSRLLIIKIIFH